MSWFIQLREKHGTVFRRILNLTYSGDNKFINEVLSTFDQGHNGRPTFVPVREAMSAMTTEVTVLPVRLQSSYHLHSRCRCGVILVDTPGFDHTDMSEADVFLKVATWVKSHCPSSVLWVVLLL
jgi:hypothetical protein